MPILVQLKNLLAAAQVPESQEHKLPTWER